MAMHLLDSREPILGAMQWYAHRVTVLRRKCIIAMELRSRYCMVFAGLTKAEFQSFPDIFADRLWREVVSVCRLDDESSQKLGSLVDMVAEDQIYQSGSDRSVQAHINDVSWQLKDMAEEFSCLPEKPEDAFSFGVQVNELLRKCKGDKDYFTPEDVFKDFWNGMLEHFDMQMEQDASQISNVAPMRRH